MPAERVGAICRDCAVSCGVFMDIEDGRVTTLIAVDGSAGPELSS